MSKQPERHRFVAIDDLTVSLERSPQTAQTVRQQFITFRANAGNTDVPQLGQRPGGAFRDQFADFPLKPDAILPHPFSAIVRGARLERAIDQSGKRLHRLPIAACAQEHEREIIAKRGQIPVSGKNCRKQDRSGRAHRTRPVTSAP